MNQFPVDLLRIVYEYIPRTTDNDVILERLHSVMSFDPTGFCRINIEICRIRTFTDVHLVYIDFSSSSECVRLCVTDVAYIRIPGKLLQHPDKLMTARFLLSLLFNVVNERLPNPQQLYTITDDIPVVETEAAFVSRPDFIRIWYPRFIEPRGLQHCCKTHITKCVLEAMHTRVPYLAGSNVKYVKAHYKNHPLTIETVNQTLTLLGEKLMTRNFVKKWCKNARYKTDYYFLTPGKVGHGNKTFVLLTIGGFFDLLHTRSRSRATQRMLFKAHKTAQELQTELKIASDIENRMLTFVPAAARRPGVLSYMM
jgi:hypothetical protein